MYGNMEFLSNNIFEENHSHLFQCNKKASIFKICITTEIGIK